MPLDHGMTPFVTLSFLFTTPEAWVPTLGDAQHGFPYLPGAGRLVIKDVLLLAGGLLVMADSARARSRRGHPRRHRAAALNGACKAPPSPIHLA
jgi:reactive chlorine resistance protein C